MALHLFGHLQRQVGAAVKHGEEHPLHRQSGVEPPLHQAHGGEQVAETFQGVVLALDGDQQGVGRTQGVDSEQLQGRGAVDEDVVVLGRQGVQRLFQQVLPVGNGDHFDAGAGQGLVGGDHVPVLGGADRLLGVGSVDEDVVYVGGCGVLVHTHAGRGVGLGVEVTQQHPLAQRRQGGGEVYRSGGLAHAAFLIHDGDNFGHGVPPEVDCAGSPGPTFIIYIGQPGIPEFYYINLMEGFQLPARFFQEKSGLRRKKMFHVER